MKTFCLLLSVGLVTAQLALPAQAAFQSYTTVKGKQQGRLKGEAKPTPAPSPSSTPKVERAHP